MLQVRGKDEVIMSILSPNYNSVIKKVAHFIDGATASVGLSGTF